MTEYLKDLDDRLRATTLVVSLPSPRERARLRRRLGLSQRDIAELVGVSRALVCRWERGERRPIGETGLRYASILRELKQRTPK